MAIPNASASSLRARLCLGLVVLALACDRGPAPEQAGTPGSQPAAGQEVPPPPPPVEIPKSLMRVGGTYVTAGSQDNVASVDEIEGVEYHWTINGGSITDGDGTSSITYSVDEKAGTVQVYCHLKNAKGGESTASTSMLVVAPPKIESFECRPAIVTEGSQGNLFWNVREIKSLTLDPGGIDATKTGTLPVQPKETTEYTLKAVNLAGTTISRKLTVKVVPPPVIRSFGAEGRIMVGQPISMKADFANGHAEIRQGDTVLGSSDQSPLTVQVTPVDNMTLTLTVTNEGGTVVSQTRTLQRVGN